MIAFWALSSLYLGQINLCSPFFKLLINLRVFRIMKSCLKLHMSQTCLFDSVFSRVKNGPIENRHSLNKTSHLLPVIHSKGIYFWTWNIFLIHWSGSAKAKSFQMKLLGHDVCSLLLNALLKAGASCWFPGRHWENSVTWSQVPRASAWHRWGKQLAFILACPAVYNPQPLLLIRLCHTHCRKPLKLPPGFTAALSSFNETLLFISE